ncbi:N-acetyltransferase [Robertkochia marina]|uniref:N-acetyltransferase n=1 Tax=Robertkochia marina TaxID=1227945 RepID=A0A4S3M2D6_9FLAO|nr:GNAT family N-acetyltransferase [Robertkochia marina]THD69284.1 N-acetyltransferase [Robertkochia marina]TRZ47457.1 N-acetyltransferase [Robertkochia marina]
MAANTEKLFFRMELQDEFLLLKPAASSDFETLFAVASDPLIWKQHNAHDRWKEEVFKQFFADGMANELGMYLIIDKRTGAVIGGTRFYKYDPGLKEVRIGYTFLARACWGTGINRRVKNLMLNHAFQKVTTVYFDVFEKNFRSQHALKKLGARKVAKIKDKLVFALTPKDCG